MYLVGAMHIRVRLYDDIVVGRFYLATNLSHDNLILG